MAIEKKLIHFGKLADFEAQLTAGNILDYSIVFIQDAKKIWTHGTYYDCSESGASEETSNYYITEFTYYDYYNAASENGQLQISANDATGLIDSIERGSRILIPYGDSVSGYAIMLGENDNGEVYVAVYSTRDVITALFFENDIRQGNNLTFDNDVTISNAIVYEADTASRPNTLAVRDSSGAIETNGIIDDQGNWWVTPTSSEESRNAADAILQWEITDLEEIREGASKGATAVQPSALPTKVSQLENDSNFITSDGLKTINGESILGSGDITISGGGSSSGSGAYPVEVINVPDAYYGLHPNTYYIIDGMTLGDALHVTLNEPTDNSIVNEYIFEFYVKNVGWGFMNPLILPDTIKFANDVYPDIKGGYTYVISIINNLAIFAEFSGDETLGGGA